MKYSILQKAALILVLFIAGALSVPAAEPASGTILGGSLNAPIRIDVFSDFECPSCRELYLDVMRRLVVEYSGKNKVCVIYHEFPLKSHKYSYSAARYAEAASRFGREKLLKVYDILFKDQAQWAQSGNIEASIAKVMTREELVKLKKIMAEPGINAAIEREIQLGNQRRIISTPTFFIYDGRKEQRVEGRLTYISLKQFIDAH